MVRRSRNTSNLRRASQFPDLVDYVDQLAGETYSIAPGEVFTKYASKAMQRDPGLAAQLRRVLDSAGALTAPASGRTAAAPASGAPGAVLDQFDWARNLGSFLHAVRTDDKARTIIAAAWTERVGSEGGYLLPESLRKGLLAYLSSAVIWPRATVVPASTYRIGLPYLDNPNQSNGRQGLGGLTFGIVENGKPIPSSGPAFGRTVLDAKKVAGLIEGVPNELLSDASDAVSDLLARVIGMGYAWFVDDLAFNGTGVGEPQGIMNSPAAFGVDRTTSGAVVNADVVAMLKGLHPASKESAVWLMSTDVFDSLIEQYEAIGDPPDGQFISPPQTLRFSAERGEWECTGCRPR